MKKLVVVTIAVFLTSLSLFAQTDANQGLHNISINIPEVALVDIEGGASITLTPEKPNEAGEALNFSAATNNSLWINYSSIVASGKARTVSAAITSGTVPTGLVLKVTAGSYAGGGKGTHGSATSAVTLSATGQSVITGIKSCYTGNGTSNGHNLTYNLELQNADAYANLVQADSPITITYTINDDL